MAIAHRSRLIEGGKLVIPAPVRRALGVVAGDILLLDMEGGDLRVRSLARAVEHAQALVRKTVPEGVSLTEELAEDRRAAAARE